MFSTADVINQKRSSIGTHGGAGTASEEVSRLLLDAASMVNQDEAIAIYLVKKASSLLQRKAELERHAAPRRYHGGLAGWQIAKIKAYIEERLPTQIALDDLAGLTQLSTSYFSAAFKVSFGLTPHAYVISRRVERAKRRIMTSNTPLSEIALDCGMSDQSHMSRLFKRVTGTTPNAWRRFTTSSDVSLALQTAV